MFGKREKIRRKLFSSLYFFYIFISSRSSFLIFEKILEIWRKDSNQSKRRSSCELALSRRPIRSGLRMDFSLRLDACVAMSNQWGPSLPCSLVAVIVNPCSGIEFWTQIRSRYDLLLHACMLILSLVYFRFYMHHIMS